MAITRKRKVDQEESEKEEQVDTVTPEDPQQQQANHEFYAGDAARGLPEGDDDDEDISRLLEPLPRDQLISLLCSAASSDPSTLAEIHRLADVDPSHRKIFIHGLNWNTTADTLRSCFSQHGEIDDCRVVTDRHSGKSKGYGFVLFRHRRSAQRALRSPQNLIDGRMTACQLASTGPTASQQGHQQQASHHHQTAPTDTLSRKIYVGNVNVGIDGNRLLEFFSKYGEIEEGPLGFDRQTGKPKGFALFIYRTVEGARKALEEPSKNFEGHVLHCQRATDGQKFRSAGGSALTATSAASLGPGGGGYNMQGAPGYNGPANAGNFNGTIDMALAQGLLSGQVPFGQGMQANAAALAMLAAAGQNPAAFGVSPALLASLNPALVAAMSAGASPMAMQSSVPAQNYSMATSAYQNMAYQTPQTQGNQGGGVTYQSVPVGQTSATRPPMGPMGGYGTY